MKIVQVKDIVFNEAPPKICVPLVGKTKSEILQEVDYLQSVDFDVIEFRVDHYEHVQNFEKVRELLSEISSRCNKPLLFTFRTQKEGGVQEMEEKKYYALIHMAIESGSIDLVDIELNSAEDEIKSLIEAAKMNKVKVIMSNHDFHKTPPKEELVNKLVKMQELNADITKIAVMPQSEEDVLILLSATLEMKKNKGDRPCITMSMGPLGIISRFSGELFGSCMTFAAARQVSAPGQVNAVEVRNILNLLQVSK